MPGLNPPPSQTVGSKATPPYGLLGGIPTPETSGDVLLLGERVAKQISRHALSVLQWFVGKRASWHSHCRSYLSVDNTDKRFPDSSSISGCLRLIKDLHQDTHCTALAVSESQKLMLAYVSYYRSSAQTSSRTHEQAVDYNSQCTNQAHVSAYLVWLALDSRHSIGIKNVFLWTFRTVTIMGRFCRIQPVQMHHHNLRREMSSRQSACHHPLMHDAAHNRQISDTKRGERWRAPYLRCSLELLLRHGHLNVFSIRSTLDVAIWRKCSASYALGASSISTKHYTDKSMLHAWLCHTTRYRRCKPSMVYTAAYDGWLSPGVNSPSTVTMEDNMFPFHQWCMVVVTGCQVA